MNEYQNFEKVRKLLVTSLLFIVLTFMQLLKGQGTDVSQLPPRDLIDMRVVESAHRWQPPFGTDRVGQIYDLSVTIHTSQLPEGEFFINTYSKGNVLKRNPITLNNKVPFSGILFGGDENNQFELSFYGTRAFIERRASYFNGITTITGNPDLAVLFFNAKDQKPVEVARKTIQLLSFECEAEVFPEEIINPVDLGTILVPADWLLLAGRQKAIVKVAALNRSVNLLTVRLSVWYASSEENKYVEYLTLEPGIRTIKDICISSYSKLLKNDFLNISVEDETGKTQWQKQIKVMIVPEKPVWPAFGALYTKLRYDAPILNVVKGRNDTLNYDNAWKKELQDIVVFLPNGSRYVFWRGTSYIPVWSGKYNTGLCYEWAERASPNVGFVDCPEPLMDKQLRYGRVEIIESTNVRIHVRWSYQSCDFNYKVNGDIPVEDYYFYPDGYGTRVLRLASIPEAEYEVEEFIILSPQSALPLSFIPSEPVELISLESGEKAAIHLPEWFARIQNDQPWKKLNNPAVYRVRPHIRETFSAISFNPGRKTKPSTTFGAFYEDGFLVTPAYWGGHWPLNQGFNTMGRINESMWAGPSHNSLMSWATKRPESVTSSLVKMNDALGVNKMMKVESWVWLIGMTDQSDEDVLRLAQSFAEPPALETSGAKPEAEKYNSGRRAHRLIVENKKVEILVKPVQWCVNPVFELSHAPRVLYRVRLGEKFLESGNYAWDGSTLWIKAAFNYPQKLTLEFGEL